MVVVVLHFGVEDEARFAGAPDDLVHATVVRVGGLAHGSAAADTLAALFLGEREE